MFKPLIICFVLSLNLRIGLTSEFMNACDLWTITRMSIGLNMPSKSGPQTFFLIIKDFFCELEAKYNSEDRTQFGISFGFKNTVNQCKRADWLYPTIPEITVRGHPYQCAFGLRSTNRGRRVWDENIVALISIWTKSLTYSVFPMNSTDLTPVSSINHLSFPLIEFIPTVAYNLYSRQSLSSFVLFEQKYRSSTKLYDLRAQVYNIDGLAIQNVTDDALMELNDNQLTDNSMSGYHRMDPDSSVSFNRYLPKAVFNTDRTMRIVGLFGIAVKNGPDSSDINATIILFRATNGLGQHTYWYCVTPEHQLSDECKSTNKYKLFVDCNQNVANTPTGPTDDPFDYEDPTSADNGTVASAKRPRKTRTRTKSLPTEHIGHHRISTEPDSEQADDGRQSTPVPLVKKRKKSSSNLLLAVTIIIIILILFVTSILLICPSDPYKK